MIPSTNTPSALIPPATMIGSRPNRLSSSLAYVALAADVVEAVGDELEPDPEDDTVMPVDLGLMTCVDKWFW